MLSRRILSAGLLAVALVVVFAGTALAAGPGGVVTHTVAAGDTLWSLAQTYETTVAALAAANGIANPDLIQVGQVLTVTAPEEAGAASPAVESGEAYTVAVEIEPPVLPAGGRRFTVTVRVETRGGTPAPDGTAVWLGVWEAGVWVKTFEGTTAAGAAVWDNFVTGEAAGPVAFTGCVGEECATARLTKTDGTGYIPGRPWNWTGHPRPSVEAARLRGVETFYVTEAHPLLARGPFAEQRRVYERELPAGEPLRVWDVVSGDFRWALVTTGDGHWGYFPTDHLNTLPPEPEAEAATYTVVAGDTLWSLAQTYETTVAALAAANGIANPDLIQVGQVLVIPTE